MVRALLRNDDDVGMRDAIPVYQISNPLEGKHSSHSPTDGLCNGHDVRRDRVGHVSEMIDMRVGNDNAFPCGRRLQSHEGRDTFVVVHEARRCSFRDDFAEDARHCAERDACGYLAPELTCERVKQNASAASFHRSLDTFSVR
jgi:hypothetical protein